MKIIDLTKDIPKEVRRIPSISKNNKEITLTKIKNISNINKEGYNISKLEIVNHFGTHIESSSHFIKAGKEIKDYDIKHFIGSGQLIIAENDQIFGEIIIIDTNQVQLTEKFINKVISFHPKIIGVPNSCIDKNNDNFAIHKMIFKDDILILEGLDNIEHLKNLKEFSIVALPLKLAAEASPVRVIAIECNGGSNNENHICL